MEKPLPHDGDFYPRPPCGGRPFTRGRTDVSISFLSTSPLRGTTRVGVGCFYQSAISIHVPLAGDDSTTTMFLRSSLISIHVPLAGDDASRTFLTCWKNISIHVPLAGDDHYAYRWFNDFTISIHVPLAGDDVDVALSQISITPFLSTSPLRGTTLGSGKR